MAYERAGGEIENIIAIMGLGNPGPRYTKTRHNLGFVVLDGLLRSVTPAATSWHMQEDVSSLMWKGEIEGHAVLLALPQTFMNNSGQAAKQLTAYYRIPLDCLWVVHDDLDLPVGKLKIRRGGGSAGHRGVESIIAALGGDDFVRFRIGIGHPHYDAHDTKASVHQVDAYVLGTFMPKERVLVRRAVNRTVKAVGVALAKGLSEAMTQCNQ